MNISITDTAGNIGTAAPITVTKDTRILTAVLNNTLSSPSKMNSLNITVSGSGIDAYYYKLGPAASTNCSVVTGYSNENNISAPISDSVASFSDGSIKLCVIGKSSTGNSQSYNSATEWVWVRDTTSPTITLTNTDPYISKDIATFTLLGTCSSDVTSITISGDLSYTINCTSNTWSQNLATLTLPDSAIDLTFTASDAAGNTTAVSQQFDTRLCQVMAPETSYSARGDGSVLNPYLICNVNQFKDIQASDCNTVQNVACNKHFKIMDDINFFGQTILPIGDPEEFNVFTGGFDGNSKILSNLNLTATTYNMALFAYAESGSFKNIVIENGTLEEQKSYQVLCSKFHQKHIVLTYSWRQK